MRTIQILALIFYSVVSYSEVDCFNRPFNHYQIKGTHNSYHIAPNFSWSKQHKYSHHALTIQLGDYKVRQLEIDMHKRKNGTFEVTHIPFIDKKSHCDDFKECLEELNEWSSQNENREHFPITVWVEFKQIGMINVLPRYKKFNERDVKTAEDQILDILGKDKLYTPLDLIGRKNWELNPDWFKEKYALKTKGWPVTEKLKGKFIFILLNLGGLKKKYYETAQYDKDRVFFLRTKKVKEETAAFFKENHLRVYKDVPELLGSNYHLTLMTDRAWHNEDKKGEVVKEIMNANIQGLTGDGGFYNNNHFGPYFPGECQVRPDILASEENVKGN